MLKANDRWLVYFDEYTRRHYKAMRTDDFETWQEVDTPMTYPQGMRHGTGFAVTEEIANELLKL